MKNMKIDNGYNRRNAQRRKLMEPVSYSTGGGVFQSGRLINLGHGGARLIIKDEVEVGDTFTVLHQVTANVSLQSEVEVRWAEVLPGGVRQVVGVRELKTTMLPTKIAV